MARFGATDQHGARAEKGRREQRAWFIIQIFADADFEQASVFEHAYAVGKLECLFLIVRHQDRSDAKPPLNLFQAAPQLRADLASDPHSPSDLRVNGVVRNMDEWYAALHVMPGDALYLDTKARVHIW